MPQIVKQPKTQIKIVPRDGEIEITLNINISIDGQVVSQTTQAQVAETTKEKEAEPLVPDFFSGAKLQFGKSFKSS